MAFIVDHFGLFSTMFVFPQCVQLAAISFGIQNITQKNVSLACGKLILQTLVLKRAS